MKPSPRPGLIAAGTALALLVAPVATASVARADPIVDQSMWTKGTTGFNTYLYCDGYTCLSYFMVGAQVNRLGPIGNESATPRVGERFYLHAYTAIVSPFTLNDSYKMRLLLPTGLTPDIRSDTDVQCAITDLSFNVTRQIGRAECQDPVKFGVQWEFPNVYLSKGEAVSFFVPVVADRTFDGSQTIQLTSDAVSNPYNLLPDPVLSQLGVEVKPAPPQPTPTPTPTPSTTATTIPNPNPTPSATAPVQTPPPAGTGTQGSTSVTATAVAKRSKLKVTVSPDLGAEKQWTVRMSKKKRGSWITLNGTHQTTKGKVTINLGKGLYRATVTGAHGFSGSTSGSVRLVR